MPHSWIAFDIAEMIVTQLIEGGLAKRGDELKIRGIIQIILEDNVQLKGWKRKEMSNENISGYPDLLSCSRFAS